MSVRHRVHIEEANGSTGDLHPPPEVTQSPAQSPPSITSSTESRSLQSREREDEESRPKYALRIIKWTALVIVAVCTLTGTVVSKVSLVSITGRMYNLSLNFSNFSNLSDPAYSSSRNIIKSYNTGSKLFIQLVFLLLIPELISFLRCLIWGVIGKTSNKFPWPDWKAIIWGLFTTTVEVAALCGFVFGVACKLPPALTILVLNGCFCFPIGAFLAWRKVSDCIDSVRSSLLRPTLEYATNFNGNYHQFQESASVELNNVKTETSQQSPGVGQNMVTFILEVLGFIMQVGVLVAIPILLKVEEDRFYYIAVLILLPISLFFLSIVWSGWAVMQKKITRHGKIIYGSDRLKAGLITSAVRILLIPFVSYGYARVVLNLPVSFDSNNFVWDDSNELSIFLTHLFVSFVAYVFAWIACALQSWTFLFPMLLSTPISFGWYAGCVGIDGVFPFVDEYLVDWNIKWSILVVASLLWISQYLAFSYHIFKNSDNVLTNDADLFWMPRYNSVFLEQHLVLNRKTAITGYSGHRVESFARSIISDNCHIFICSTMYHENEDEMRQMLRSIFRVAVATKRGNNRSNKYESHIFFDGACSGQQLNPWVMQLLGLLKDTLNVDPHYVTKFLTPYGMQLKYKLCGEMPFYIHLKDNSKVKNKKRWSQVMYMNYVLNFRIGHNKLDPDRAYILTTDADIDFTSDSVLALLDILACEDGVGAVCARTYPLGNGPVVWYQIFDYTVGHWFQKAAEHILGCVLCCPGCFSVFRVSALKDVLETYGGTVETGFDFLTKDMGEDRWLCTLLIQKGWRLEYSAVSKDSTYCPETFDEFYKQRRRWIPSTMANLSEVISSYYEITSNNDSISILFIIYQFLTIFSTLISPATVILIIVTGLTALDPDLSEVALIVVLSVIAVLYGLVCIYATEKTQIDVAKILTFVFAIIMAVVISGILTDIINDVIEGDPTDHTNSSDNDDNSNFRFPVDISAIYLAVFAFTFVVAGFLHFNEILGLFHFIWYLLCLPSGYLFLLIYSVSNINNRSWGTREGASPKSSKSDGWVDYFFGLWDRLLGFLKRCIGKKKPPPAEDVEPTPNQVTDHHKTDLLPFVELSQDVIKWLKKIECYDNYWENFENEGYTELDFIATMKTQDFKAIGIDRRGFLLKLEKEVKKLPTPELKTKIPKNVAEWLNSLKLGHYIRLFKSEGYSTDEDVENLIGLTKKDLQGIGITRRGDIRVNKTRTLMDTAAASKLSEFSDACKKENDFWDKLSKEKLQPESANFSKVEELKQKLKDLRNFSLLALLLTNVMWIVFLYTLVFPQLTKYNLPERAFSLLFLAVFSIIIVIQFIAMIFHRFVTLLHLLAGISLRSTDSAPAYSWLYDDVELVSLNPRQS